VVEPANEDTVFEAVQERVFTGEHLDHVPGAAAPPAPAPAEVVGEAEQIIGYRMPPLLRRLYLEVANGGFGPGYGILGLRGGHTADGRTALDLYRQTYDRPAPSWPARPAALLPLCHWGCGIYSYVDCSQPDGPIWGSDPNPGRPLAESLFSQPFTMAEWLSRWIRHTLVQPTLVQDPVTGQWRGATEAEYAQFLAELNELNG
jgi:hypothetical protein